MKTLCAASAGTRTRVFCLAGDNPATEPLMLELSCSPFEQKLCPSIQFFNNILNQIHERFNSFEF